MRYRIVLCFILIFYIIIYVSFSLSFSRAPDISLKWASKIYSRIYLFFACISPPSPSPVFCRHVSSPRFLVRKRGTVASGCGTPAINLSRHAIIFVPSAGIHRETAHTDERRYILTRARRYYVRVHARAAGTDDENERARDSRTRDNDNTRPGVACALALESVAARTCTVACASRPRNLSAARRVRICVYTRASNNGYLGMAI